VTEPRLALLHWICRLLGQFSQIAPCGLECAPDGGQFQAAVLNADKSTVVLDFMQYRPPEDGIGGRIGRHGQTKPTVKIPLELDDTFMTTISSNASAEVPPRASLGFALAIFELAWLGLGSRSAWRRLRGPLSDHGAQARGHLAPHVDRRNVTALP
jgi:hypothetical protein